MKAILLAAGFGTRLKPLTLKVPKCLVTIDDRPLMTYWLDALIYFGIDEVLVNTHYHANQVEDFIGGYAPGGFVKTVYEKELLGTGGTLLKNHSFFGNEPVLVIHADNLCFANLSQFINAHKKRPSSTVITMMTFLTEFPEDSGIVELDGDGIVWNLYEKVRNPPSNTANGAVYIFEPIVLDFMKANCGTPTDISTEVLPSFLGRIFSWPTDGLHIDIGTPERIKMANTLVRSMQNNLPDQIRRLSN